MKGVSWLQDSEEELPDMSDEQMFKMDKLLAAVLRTQKDAKDRSKNTKQAPPPPLHGHPVDGLLPWGANVKPEVHK